MSDRGAGYCHGPPVMAIAAVRRAQTGVSLSRRIGAEVAEFFLQELHAAKIGSHRLACQWVLDQIGGLPRDDIEKSEVELRWLVGDEPVRREHAEQVAVARQQGSGLHRADVSRFAASSSLSCAKLFASISGTIPRLPAYKEKAVWLVSAARAWKNHRACDRVHAADAQAVTMRRRNSFEFFVSSSDIVLRSLSWRIFSVFLSMLANVGLDFGFLEYADAQIGQAGRSV
jgi:hypothetical protein